MILTTLQSSVYGGKSNGILILHNMLVTSSAALSDKDALALTPVTASQPGVLPALACLAEAEGP